MFDDPEFQTSRARVGRNVNPTRAYAEEHPDEFAGLFVDEFEGLVYVAFTDGLEGHTATLRSLVADPEAIRVLPADYSLAELRAVQAQIGADNLILQDLGIQVSAVGPDERINRVMVMLAHLDDAAMNEFCARYGADLFVFEEGVIHAVAAPAPGLDQSGSVLRPIDPPGAAREGSSDEPPWPQLLALGVATAAFAAGLRRRRARAAEAEASE